MLNIQDNVGSLIANETKGALKAIDNAILNELRLCTSLVEAFEATNLPVGPSQKLLQSLANGLNHFVAGRGEMAHTVKTLTAIKSASRLKETSYNCPGQMVPLLATQEAEKGIACSVTAYS